MTSVVHNDTYPAIDSAKADLSGKHVFFSGASKGLGKAMSISFAKAGASMIAIGARSDLPGTAKKMEEAATALGKPAPKILLLQLDVTDTKSAENAAAQVKKAFGRLDIVINNAGIVTYGKIVDSDPDEWMRVFDVNLKGPYLVLRSFIPLLLEGGDKTAITVSSVGAHIILPGYSAYQTSKLAELRLCEFVNQLFVETAELSGDSLVYLTSEKRNWLAGRYVNVTWDLPELMTKEAEIVKDNKLVVRLVV
ncbi:uncharacterized protein BCR38DRAFT_461136 [Pseudomassariella vexata]|uniref:Uncharacterized protein n=1 Tax=Pseudomassariella vexata TaxID=1141098 RepID=A0A1Y2DF57_9PEZI|nr:uncharacterized protein BCR38DRAFT_461136 [Pseudomassariella vexata]ORY57889.1 hypothetical protein BCR38DRAFT_461136 [Pseudomassariella vexata]